MSKLYDLKKWLTLEETARHLSNVFEEEVTEADVLRLALDGQLKISILMFESANAYPAKEIPIAKKRRGADGMGLGDGTFCEFNDSVGCNYCMIDGLCDLVMKGEAILAVERRYRELLGFPSSCGSGTVERNLPPILLITKDDNLYVVENGQEGNLPHGAMLAVRVEALNDLQGLKQEAVAKGGVKEKAKDDRFFKKSALIASLKPHLKAGTSLEGLLSNASKYPDLSTCKSPTGRGWCLKGVLRFLADNGYLKDEHMREVAKAGFEQLLKTIKS